VPSPSHVSLAFVCCSLVCVAPVPCSLSRCHWSPPRFHCSVLVICLAPVCGVLRPRPCPHPGPGPCTPPSTLRAVARSGSGGVLGCGSGCSPRASCPRCASLPHASGPMSCHCPWCSPFPPHEQLLVAVVQGAAVLVDVGNIRL
jgi:hypothetical protein